MLVLGRLGDGIAATERGEAIYYARVATNTNVNGTVHSPDEHCQAWTSAKTEDKPQFGYNAVSLDATAGMTW